MDLKVSSTIGFERAHRWQDEQHRPQVLDVREQGEWDAGRIPGAVHEPYRDIRGIPDGIDATREVAVICGSGQRSAVAASLLQRYGVDDVVHVVEGGAPLWKRARLADRASAETVGLTCSWRPSFGVAIGLAVGVLGGGGSVLAVPVLVYVLSEDVESATTISLVVVSAAAVAGGFGHALERRICWRHAAAFTVAALPGIVVGTALGNVVGGAAPIAAFAAVMLVAAAATWRNASADQPADEENTRGHRCPALRLGRDLAAARSSDS